MAFDFKKEYKGLYLPGSRPSIVTVPPMNYIAVRGKGDPNREDGEYKAAVGILYGIAFTIKMSKKGDHGIDGYFDFVVPPLEVFWRQDGTDGMDETHKERFQWISVLRMPDFVTKSVFDRAAEEAAGKKKMDFSRAALFSCSEGLCVQCMHTGPYEGEPETIDRMHRFAEEQGYVPDLSQERMHHEIYLSDPRKIPPEKRRTVLRHPIRSR